MGAKWLQTIAVIVVLTPVLAGQVPPGRWEKLDSQVVGTKLKVTLTTGSLIEGTFQRSGSGDVTVTNDTGDIIISKSDVGKIVTRNRKDSLKNGMLIGFVAGGGSAILPATLLAEYCGNEVGPCNGAAIGFVAIGAGIGTLVGMLADRVKEGDEVLYQARPK